MAQISLQNLTCGYDKKAVVTGLSCQIEAGEYLCILGENGAGKSTLLKTVLGIQKPISGSVVLNGVKRRDFGYLPQQKDVPRDFPASVTEVVLSGFVAKSGLRPFYTKGEKTAAREHMERLGVLHLSQRCFRELSGGQQRRVLLARALCAAEKMLFLDEPAAGLDPETTDEMYRLIAELNAQKGVTVVAVSHDLDAVEKYAARVLRLGTPVCGLYSVKDYFNAAKEADL
jgi:zinc transport system ATP-binding protein